MEPFDVRPLGDQAIRVGFGNVVSKEIHQRIRTFCTLLEQITHPAVKEWVPSYTAVTIFYDCAYWSYEEAVKEIKRIAAMKMEGKQSLPARIVRIPVCYGGKWGPDLAEVASRNGITEEEVVRLHSDRTYLVYMIGFAPGFPYLGGLNPLLATPRKKEPRRLVPAGSVGIAGEQTGIYPLATPGGWQLIGQTPFSLYDPNREEPTLLRAGDELIFYAISPREFESIRMTHT
ncbi:5-oxoprolinase subunit PxpB [bacterium LRH843]|nr:5-oxoprolinase subunit PxpB [bacterium LRH843]